MDYSLRLLYQIGLVLLRISLACSQRMLKLLNVASKYLGILFPSEIDGEEITGRLAPILFQGFSIRAEPLVLINIHTIRDIHVCAIVPGLSLIQDLQSKSGM